MLDWLRNLLHRQPRSYEWQQAGAFMGRWPRIRWQGIEGADDRYIFVYEPDLSLDRFAFKRANGDTIEPGRMETDGGSIPRKLWGVRNFDPMTLLPAFILHDWIYEMHHQNLTDYTLRDANLTMAESIYTLDAMGLARVSQWQIEAMFLGVQTAGKLIWDREPT